MRNIDLIAEALKAAGMSCENPEAFKSRSAWKKLNKAPKEGTTPLRVKLWCGSNGHYITKWTDLYSPDQVTDIP